MDCRTFSTALACFTTAGGEKQTVVAHYEYAAGVGGSTLLYAVRYTQPDGTPVDTSAGTVSAGQCLIASQPATLIPAAVNLASGSFAGSHDPNGFGADWDQFSNIGKLQSVTVTALEAGDPASGNTVAVSLGGSGYDVWLVKGQSMTWSVAQDSGPNEETLFQDIRVRLSGDSAATVHWVEQQT